MTHIHEKPPLAELAAIQKVLGDDYTEAYLEHYGVKGMKWGVRKERDLVGRKSSGKKESTSGSRGSADNSYALTDHDKEILRKAGLKPGDGPALKAKYGPGSLEKNPQDPEKGLTPGQKKAIKRIAIGVGVGAALWYLHHEGKKLDPRYGLDKNFLQMFDDYQASHLARFNGGLTDDMVKNFSTKAVSLDAGAIFKRISTENESFIKPGGFYACFDPEDVERYKAILPVYWKSWGLYKDNGYIVNLKAKTSVKAPSPRETFELFKNMLDDEIETNLLGIKSKTKVRQLWYGSSSDDYEAAKALFPKFALNWNDLDHPVTQHFFAKLRAEGYNAVIDMNDAGHLAKTPMRLLDSNMFDIQAPDVLSKIDIKAAQSVIEALKHAFRELGNILTGKGESMQTQEEKTAEFLAHYGVKGMKWGVRRSRKQTGLSRTRGALVDRNERNISKMKKRIDKEGALNKADSTLLRGVGLEKKWTKQLEKAIGNMEAQNARLKSGQAKTSDILQAGFGATPIELLFSVRPEKK